MELDDLKYQLTQKLSTDHTERSGADFAQLLTRKTVSVIDKLKRSLWLEILFCLPVILLFSYIGITSRYPSMQIYFSVFTVVMGVFMFLLIYLLRKINHLSNTLLPVKSNLETIVSITEEFVKRYFQFIMVLIPVCFVFSFLLGYYEPNRIPELDRLSEKIVNRGWKLILLLIAYFVGLSAGTYYLTKWYLKKLYGNYLEQLKKCIAELSETE